MSEMRISIKSLKIGKAGGPDDIISGILTDTLDTSSVIVPPFHNTILYHGLYP